MVNRITEMTAAATLTGNELLEVSQLSPTVTLTGTTLSAAASDNSINDSGSGFLAAGFAAGDRVRITGFATSGNNLFFGVVATAAAGKLVILAPEGDALVDEAAGASVTVTKWTTRRTTLQDLAAFDAYTDADAQAAIHAAPTVIAGTTHTAVIGNAYGYLQFTNGSPITFTIPTNASVPFDIGTVIAYRQAGAGVVSLDDSGGAVTLNSRGGLLDTAGQHAGVQIKKVGTDEWDIWGDVA